MKKIFLIFLVLSKVIAVSAQQQQRIWLLMDRNYKSLLSNSDVVSPDRDFKKKLKTANIDSLIQVFPHSRNDTLLRLFEIKTTVERLNIISSSAEIEQIYFPSDGDETILYNPSDYMWYCNYDDSTSWLWHLKNIMADYAWDITHGDSSVKIAILDTWFDINHPDLQNKFYCTFDPYDNLPFYTDGNKNNHGTTVASFAAAETDGGGQLASIGFDCKIIPYKAQSGRFLERAHHASLAMKADVLTSSAGGWTCDRNFNDIERIAVKEIL